MFPFRFDGWSASLPVRVKEKETLSNRRDRNTREKQTNESSHDRHLQIHQDDVKAAVFLELANCSASMLDDDDVVSVLLESLLNNHSVHDLVREATSASHVYDAVEGGAKRTYLIFYDENAHLGDASGSRVRHGAFSILAHVPQT